MRINIEIDFSDRTTHRIIQWNVDKLFKFFFLNFRFERIIFHHGRSIVENVHHLPDATTRANCWDWIRRQRHRRYRTRTRKLTKMVGSAATVAMAATKLVINSCKSLCKCASNGDERRRTSRTIVPVKAVAVQVKSYRLTNNNQRYLQIIWWLHARAAKKPIVRNSNTLSLKSLTYSKIIIPIARKAFTPVLSLRRHPCWQVLSRWANSTVWHQQYRATPYRCHRSRPMKVSTMVANTRSCPTWNQVAVLKRQWARRLTAFHRNRWRAGRRRSGRSISPTKSATATWMMTNWCRSNSGPWERPTHRMVCAWFVYRNRKMARLFTIVFYMCAVAIDAQSKYGTNGNDAQSVIHRWKLFSKCSYIDLYTQMTQTFVLPLIYVRKKWHDTIEPYKIWISPLKSIFPYNSIDGIKCLLLISH